MNYKLPCEWAVFLSCGHYLALIIWLRLVADITRALIGYERSLSGQYAAVMPTGRLRIMQIRKSSALTIYAHWNDESR